jgi:hypothetical protein
MVTSRWVAHQRVSILTHRSNDKRGSLPIKLGDAMKIVEFDRFGPPDVLKVVDVPMPEPRPDAVVVLR